MPISVDDEYIDQDVSYQLLLKIVTICKKLEFSRILFVFDRIDEDARFSNDAEEIAEFIEPILTDNKFLLEESFQVIFSTWVTPFNFIKDKVRTQKHYCPTLSWGHDDLEKALNTRLSVYSENAVNDFRVLFDDTVSEEQLTEVFEVANKNPRDLWHIFNSLFRAQYELAPESKKINCTSIPTALTNFVTTFNYYEYYPRKSNARANSMDIYSYAKHLLKLESEVFTKNQLNERAQTGSSTNNYVVGMERIGLIGLDSQQAGIAYYKIKDTKIIYALKNGLEIKRD